MIAVACACVIGYFIVASAIAYVLAKHTKLKTDDIGPLAFAWGVTLPSALLLSPLIVAAWARDWED